MKTRNLAPRLFENSLTDFLEARRRDPTLAKQVMLCMLAAARRRRWWRWSGKGGRSGREKGGRRGQHGRGGKGTNEGGGGSASTAGGDGRSAKATSESTSVGKCHTCGKKGYWRSDCTASYAADAKDGGTLPIPAPHPRHIDAVDATDGGTLLMSSPRRKNKLSWRLRARLRKTESTLQASVVKAEEQAGAVMVRGKGSCLGR